MCRSFQNVMKAMGALALVAVFGIGLATPAKAALAPITEKILANTCNGSSELNYPAAPNFSAVGDTVRVVLTLGAGGIQGGTSLSINRVRFNLDCDNANLGINCPDDGGVISYQGNLATTCASAFTADHNAGETLPNQVVFTPTSPIVVAAGTPNFCQLSFDVRVETRSNDGTPDVIEQVSGFDASLGDGVCDTAPPLAAGNTNSGSLALCPICDDGNQCNGTETCDAQLGCQPGTPITCNDNNVCTSDSCDAAVPAPGDPCVYTPGAQGDCNDNNVCTTDACDPIQGCTYTPGAQGDCNDNVCTTDACDPIEGCTHTPGAQGDCNDNNVCTTDACDPIQGCTHTPGALNCNDQSVCTTDTCDPITGCHNEPGAQGDCDDNDVCTDDKCDPETGCEHTDNSGKCDDGDTCTDDSCDPKGGCQHEQNDSCALICRTPGFWGTHADEDPGKACSQDITGAVIALAGGSLSVCGECISNTNTGETRAPNDAAGALEALCVKVQGQQERQLARQLLSAALNCVMSGVGNSCGGTNAIDWATCNAVCQGTSSAMTVGQCIDSMDSFNNGIGTGCHDRNLPLDVIFPGGTRCTTNDGGAKQGPAGSSAECNSAKGTNCTVIQPNENSCTTDGCP
jgi:hypothetical protein